MDVALREFACVTVSFTHPKPNFNVDDGPKVFHFFASVYRLPVCCFLIEVFALIVCHLDANLNANSLFVVAKILC